MQTEKLPIYFRQFIFTLRKHREAIDFIYEKKIWEGFWRYGWVAKLLIVLGVLISLKFLSIIFNWMTEADASTPLAVLSSVGTLFQNIASEGYRFLFAGSMKYIMVILLEIVIFHVSRRTLSILTGEDSDATFNAFLEAQKRMIKVVIYCFVMEMIATLLIKIFFGIFGFVDFLKPVALFAVQSYYLGFAVVDNYHEQFGMEIKESAKAMVDYLGVALAVGMFLQLAFAIPVAGTVGGPFIAAVAGTLAMHELSAMHRTRKQTLMPLKTDTENDIV